MLLAAGILSREELRQAMIAAREARTKLGRYLLERGMIQERQLVDLLAEQLRLETYHPDAFPLDVHLAAVIPRHLAEKWGVIPLKKRGHVLRVATTDPLNIQALDAAEAYTQAEIIPVICTENQWQRLKQDLYGADEDLRAEAHRIGEQSGGSRLPHYFRLLEFRREPFSNTPDPDFLCLSRQYAECLQKIEFTLRMRRGLSVILGEVGTGKTTLCRHLIRKLAPNERIETHLVLDPYFSSPLEFLTSLAHLFGPPPQDPQPSELSLKEHIHRYLLARNQDNRLVILIIDEAQELKDFCLEILREILNYETDEHKLLQVIIFAQREFRDTLSANPGFADRVSLYHELGPLSFAETRDMIQFRLDRASAPAAQGRSLFTFPALYAVYRATGGYPRKIITLCHRIVLSMIIQGRRRARWALVRSCIKRTLPLRGRRWTWALASLAVVGLGALTWHFWQGIGWENWTTAGRLLPSPTGTAGVASAPAEPGKTGLASPPAVTPSPPSMPAAAATSPPMSTPSAGVPAQASPQATVSPPPAPRPQASPTPAFLAQAALKTVRAAKHPNYARIVFEFDTEVDFDRPVIRENRVIILFKDARSTLAPFLEYRALDAAVALTGKGRDLEASIQLPGDFQRLTYFALPSPFRLVVNLY